MRDLSARIRDRRLGLGYSSGEQFAFDKGLNRSSYCLWERTGKMNMSNFFKLCEILGEKPSEMLSETFEYRNLRFRK